MHIEIGDHRIRSNWGILRFHRPRPSMPWRNPKHRRGWLDRLCGWCTKPRIRSTLVCVCPPKPSKGSIAVGSGPAEADQAPRSRSNFLASFVEAHGEAQRAQGGRGTMKYFCYQTFGVALPFM